MFWLRNKKNNFQLRTLTFVSGGLHDVHVLCFLLAEMQKTRCGSPWKDCFQYGKKGEFTQRTSSNKLDKPKVTADI